MPSLIAEVNWEALSAVVGALVFIATLVLAFSTWQMASAARKQANAAEDQSESAAEQARASAELADIARRQLAVSSSAALRVVRGRGITARVLPPPPASTGPDTHGNDPNWVVSIDNSGEAPAMIEDAILHLPAGFGDHPAYPARMTIAPTEQGTLSFPLNSEQVDRAASTGDEWNLDLPFRESGSRKLRLFRAVLGPKAAGDGWRWVVRDEQTK